MSCDQGSPSGESLPQGWRPSSVATPQASYLGPSSRSSYETPPTRSELHPSSPVSTDPAYEEVKDLLKQIQAKSYKINFLETEEASLASDREDLELEVFNQSIMASRRITALLSEWEGKRPIGCKGRADHFYPPTGVTGLPGVINFTQAQLFSGRSVSDGMWSAHSTFLGAGLR